MSDLRLSNEGIDKLIYIVDAGVKETINETIKGWYTLWIPFEGTYHKHYDLQEQLAAIQKLGYSENKNALKYLESLLVCEHRGGYSDPSNGCGDYGWMVYVNARGGLRNALEYQFANQEAGERAKDIFNRPQDKHVLSVIEKAISKVKGSLKE